MFPRQATPHRTRRRIAYIVGASLPLISLCGVAIADGSATAATASSSSSASTAAGTETIYTASTAPSVASDSGQVELGTRFSVTTAGTVTGMRYYGPATTAKRTGSLWSGNGTRLATATFATSTAKGWQTVTFSSPVHINANTAYVVSYLAPSTGYAFSSGGFKSASTHGHIVTNAGAGVFVYNAKGGFPTQTYQNASYYADVLFTPDAAGSGGSTSGSGTTPSSAPSTAPATTAPSAPATTQPSKPATSAPATTAPSTPTATSSAAPAGARNCASAPSSCGYPDATNTGVTPGTQLTDVPGNATSGSGWTWDRTNQNITVNTNGAVLQNLVVHGSIEVYASNVTIKNVHVINNGDWWAIGLHGSANTTIDHVQISSDPAKNRLEVGIKDVTGSSSGTRIEHTDISGVDTGIQVHEGLVQDNYVHDLRLNSGDHVNGFSSNGSTTPLTINHNTILDQIDQTDAISLFQDFGVEANRTVTNNLIAGGSYTLYAGGGSKGISHNITISGNRFSRIFYPTGGVFGPVTAFDKTGSGNTWSNNVWDDTSAPVNP